MTGFAHLSDNDLRRLGRLRCVVPGCGRTFRVEPYIEETICGKHWRLADRRLRRLDMAVRRKARRIGWTPRLLFLDHALWLKGKAQAIERAMGL